MGNFFVGQRASFSKTITESDVYNFAGICGDFNPIHINRIAARQSVFGKQVVHGSLVVSFISTVLGMYLPGPGTIYMKQTSKFVKPVFIGDTVTAEVIIKSISEKNISSIETVVKNQDDEIVVEGEAVVKLP